MHWPRAVCIYELYPALYIHMYTCTYVLIVLPLDRIVYKCMFRIHGSILFCSLCKVHKETRKHVVAIITTAIITIALITTNATITAAIATVAFALSLCRDEGVQALAQNGSRKTHRVQFINQNIYIYIHMIFCYIALRLPCTWLSFCSASRLVLH